MIWILTFLNYSTWTNILLEWEVNFLYEDDHLLTFQKEK